MQFNLTHSLRTHLESKTGLPTVWVYDGVKLPKSKPFITVEQMQNNTELISKQRTALTTYRYQVGLYAATIRERSLKQEEIKRTMLSEKIELLDAETPGQTLGYFYAIVTAEVPITPEDISDKSKYHRIYFDVEIDVTF